MVGVGAGGVVTTVGSRVAFASDATSVSESALGCVGGGGVGCGVGAGGGGVGTMSSGAWIWPTKTANC